MRQRVTKNRYNEAMRLLRFIALLLFSCIMFSAPVSAQNSTALTIAPAIIEDVVQKGQRKTVELQVRNNSASALPISFYAEPLAVFEEYNPSLRQRYDASRWLSFEDEVTLFEPGQTQTIPVTITVPEDASAGGHYASVNVRALRLESIVGDRVQTVIPEISVTFLLTIAGDVDNSLFTVTKNKFPWHVTTGESLTSSIIIRNTGNVHNVVSPIVIFKKNGIEVSRTRLEPQLVLPQSERDFPLTSDALVTNGVYEVVFYQNAQDELSTSKVPLTETVLVGPSLGMLTITSIALTVAAFVVIKRKNIVNALKILAGR